MASIVWSQTLSIPKLYGGCTAGGIACMGNGELFMFFEEVKDVVPGNFNPQRLFRSIDNGTNWVELTAYGEPQTYLGGSAGWSATPGRLLSQGQGKLIIGSTGTVGANAVQAAIDGYFQAGGAIGAGAVPVSTDRGATWSNAALNVGTPSAGGTSLESFGTGFVVLDANEIWMTGFFIDDFGVNDFDFLKSTDNGVTFVAGHVFPSTPNLNTAMEGVYLGNNVVVLAADTFGTPIVIRSTDRGATWTEIAVPSAVAAPIRTQMFSLCKLGNGTLLATGYYSKAGHSIGLWKSTDQGLTWTEIRGNLPALAASVTEGQHLLSLGTSQALLSTNGNQKTGGAILFYLTEDSGTTWTACTMNGTTTENLTYRAHQVAISESGTLYAALAEAGGVNTGEIWKGVITGLAVTSPCSTPSQSICQDVHGHFLAQFTFNPATLDFGDVPIGSSSTLPLQVCNVGLATGTTPIVPDDPQLTVDQPVVTLAPGTCTTVNVTFTPTMAGAI